VLRSPIQPAHATQQMWALPGRTLFILPKDEKLQKGCLINTLLIYPSSLPLWRQLLPSPPASQQLCPVAVLTSPSP
jgi:hypothetical protein